LEIAWQALVRVPAASDQEKAILKASGLLSQLLLQDVERPEDPDPRVPGGGVPRPKQGVPSDRIVSGYDRERRYGHRSATNRFEGFKVPGVVDPEGQLIGDVYMICARTGDSGRPLELVEASEQNTGNEVEETIGTPARAPRPGCAFSNGTTREISQEARRRMVARVGQPHNEGQFTREAFQVNT
jgi:hypothetical protein